MTESASNGPQRNDRAQPRRADLDAALERAIRRDRLLVVAALALVVVLAWAYLLAGAGMGMSAAQMTRMSQQELAIGAPGERPMQGMSGSDTPGMPMGGAGTGSMGMMAPLEWTPAHALVMFLMWWIMMIAMMVPSAAPMILLFAAINRRQRERGHGHVSTALFAGAYLASWAAFSVAAVALQWAFQSLGWLSPMLVSRSATLGGVLLLLAGLYQLTPVKQACLRHCRSPIGFVTAHWRRGARGALAMGVHHGAFCVGCCWFLMLLLFLGGVMNLWWIVGLALFVLLEKTVPAGHWLGRAVGVALAALGLWVLVAGG